MFSFLTRRPARRSTPARTIRPRLECLEARDCPAGGLQPNDQLWWLLNTSVPSQNAPTNDSGPAISLSISYNQKKSVTLTGHVTDPVSSPAGLTVQFSGKVVGTAVTDANGNFSLTADASALGAINAVVTDALGNVSDTATVNVTSNAPKISNFGCVEGYLHIFTFTGTVTDESAPGLTVNFGGSPVSLQGKSVAVKADGTFEFTVQLNGTTSDNGTATAQTTDWWGLTSNLATCNVFQST